jgi:EmrB/QacA subfamily drug resistance transporter
MSQDITVQSQSELPAAGGGSSGTAGVAGRWLVLAVVLTAVFMQLLDTTITMVAIPSIQANLNASFGEIQLVVAGYSLTFACVLITGGRLGDIYGRKRLFLLGMVGFTATSALCGAAPNSMTLVIARFAQGLCSGLMLPQVLSIIQVSFPNRERPKAFAIYGATIGLATVTGPVLGGSLIKLNAFNTDWRSIFYVNLPIGLFALVLGLPKMRESFAPKADRLDLPGAALVTTGLFLLVLPLVIGRQEDWPAWSIAMLVASVPVLALFFWFESRLTARPDSSPLIRTTLFRQRSFTVGLLISVLFFAGIPSFFFVFFLTFQVGLGYSPVLAGSVSLAFAVLVAVGSARSAAVAKRLGTWTLLIGTVLAVVGMLGVMLTVRWAGAGLTGYDLLPALAVAGLGCGLFLAPCINIILAGIRAQDAGAASGVLSTVQQVGAALGIAVIGIVFFGLLRNGGAASSSVAMPQLRTQLSAAGLSPAQSDQVVAGFRTCFEDKVAQKDPTATPASCALIQRQVAASPAPAATKAAIEQAVLGDAVPLARGNDFTHGMQIALFWQLGVFGASSLLILALPKVKPTGTTPAAA